MIRISKYQYMVDVQNEQDLQATDSFFILEFEYDNKTYVGWTGNALGATVKNKIERLLYHAFSKYPQKNDVDTVIQKSLYVTLTVQPIKANNSTELYMELYGLMDKYQSYAPLGYNIINGLNKSIAEKEAIKKYAEKWGIPAEAHRRNKSCIGRPVFQYKRITENTYRLTKKWQSIREYIDSVAPTKINPSAIYMCCNGQRRIAYDCVWRFKNMGEIIEIEPDLRTISERRCAQNQQRKEKIIAEKIEQAQQKRLQFIANNQVKL